MKKDSTTIERRPSRSLKGGRKLMPDAKDWLEQRAKEKERLYEQYGKPLEEEHTGEYAAITPKGETIIGKRAGEVMKKAVDNFGERNFGIFRVGHLTFARWLKIN